MNQSKFEDDGVQYFRTLKGDNISIGQEEEEKSQSIIQK